MNKQSFISKRAFQSQKMNGTQGEQQENTMGMTFDNNTQPLPKTLARFNKLQNPIVFKKARFNSPLFIQK